jgi:putative phage-type endonuclease
MNTENEIETESKTEHVVTMDIENVMTERQHFLNSPNLEESEKLEIENQIVEEIDDYFKKNILDMSSPLFYDTMIQYMSEVFLSEWKSIKICEDEDYEDIVIIIREHLENYCSMNIVPPRFKREIESITISSIDFPKIKAQIEFLQTVPQPQQKTQEWFQMRNQMISASNLWKVLGNTSQVNSIIYEKCKVINPNNNNNTNHYSNNLDSPLHWGVKYETLSNMIYEDMYMTKLGEFGCIQHTQYPFIGASPDGINIDPISGGRYGRMVEIKNIKNREITGIPKLEYWVQTQIQMEVCDLDECDFVESRFLEYADEEAFYSDTVYRDYKGIILRFIDANWLEYASKYLYLPFGGNFYIDGGLGGGDEDIIHGDSEYINISKENRTDIIKGYIQQWIITNKLKMKGQQWEYAETIYWYLDEWSCVLIPRNTLWFQAALPKIEEVWRTIEKERENGFEHRAPNKRAKKAPLCLIKLDY